MDKQKNNNFFDFNWKQFEQFFGGKLPFLGSGDGPEPMGWVENYVKDVMKQAMPAADLQGLKHHFHTETFDTHNNVIVKIHIPDRSQARKLRVLVNSNQLRLENLPENNTQTIKLNSSVVTDSCRAVYKNGILQLHMRKMMSEHQPYQEIDIRFL
ncbi:Hsp20/alpha crystallin family protein [Paenibacillus filicis]|uniref:Hsp20/alpha crystallin family protein n=1 Tax=Paenibacillus gyeongsangnamensis TaxID=3388067 RepID=A0ABT4Q343_9BACL|nr:Hsp20/alpha crystallin family protein [Paenibacillus filicis]MCZ8511301.1 Hsp20/alpha crystallin family protein [Paenibacillus filicis]